MNNGINNSIQYSVLVAFFSVLLMWLVKWAEINFQLTFGSLGIRPLSFSGLIGIFTSPFIHGDLTHLINNSVPVFVLIALLYQFYKDVFSTILFLSILLTGVGVWLFGRPVYHIGASGLIYALAGFIFLSGIVKKHPQLIAISLLVSFLYGGIVWGILPYKEKISWESHLSGLICGFILAIIFKNQGPIRKKYDWELEEENQDLNIEYHYKE